MNMYDFKELIHQVAFSVMNEFEIAGATDTEVVKTKNNNQRDVVTALDININERVNSLIRQHYSEIKIISEEIDNRDCVIKDIETCLVIDPLDGSQNYSLSLPFYVTLVSVYVFGVVKASAIISPMGAELVLWTQDMGIVPYNLKSGVLVDGPCYFAYPPTIKLQNNKHFHDILEYVDSYTSGMYRWGSAGSGLLALYKGQIKSFVGLEIRVWDAISFLPILLSSGFKIAYKIEGYTLSLVACSVETEFRYLLSIFHENSTELLEYQSNSDVII